MDSRIFGLAAEIEDGGMRLMFSRQSTSSSITEVKRLDWSPAEMKMVGWVGLPTPFAISCLMYGSHLTTTYAE